MNTNTTPQIRGPSSLNKQRTMAHLREPGTALTYSSGGKRRAAGSWSLRMTDGRLVPLHANVARAIVGTGTAAGWLEQIDAITYAMLDKERTLPKLLRTAIKNNNFPEANRLIDLLDNTLFAANREFNYKGLVEQLKPILKGY